MWWVVGVLGSMVLAATVLGILGMTYNETPPLQKYKRFTTEFPPNSYLVPGADGKYHIEGAQNPTDRHIILDPEEDK